MNNPFAEFGPDDIVAYLNQKLPGFEPSIINDPGLNGLTIRVRTNVPFAAYQSSTNDLRIPLSPYGMKGTLDELILKTRQDVIQRLGLQEEIDAEVKRAIDRERRDIEEKSYKRAMDDALRKVVSDLVPKPSLDAVLHFINGGAQ